MTTKRERRAAAKGKLLASIAIIVRNMTCEDWPYEDCDDDAELAESLLKEISNELHRRSERLT